jgi:hypothetical protein
MPHTRASNTDSNQRISVLNERLNQRLLAYATVAGAAGVSMLAMTQAAGAEVVYTATNRSIHQDSVLDLNNDGIHDYYFHGDFSICGTCTAFYVIGIKGNKMMSNAQPLASGITVGPDAEFRRGRDQMTDHCTCSGHSASGGPWLGVQNEYMGLEFRINGEAHFGWARFSVTDKAAITLTGYAYETIPLKPIVTGDTGGNDNADHNDKGDQSGSSAAPALQPAGLGQLALGAAAR